MSKKLWGGRFAKDTDNRVKEWCESITADECMVVEDTWGSMGHVAQLGLQGIITEDHAKKILAGLLTLHQDYKAGKWRLADESAFKNHDDVHMQIEARLIDAIGMDAAGRMHTCRSRNDQVSVSWKMHTRRLILELREKMLTVVASFLERAKDYVDDPMVSYTHVQHAQPISIAYWLSHYAAVFLRDLDRLKRSYDITDECTLGSGAISGTSFPIDRELSARLLGFQKVHLHCMDATTSRDFMLEVLSNVAILQTTYSKLAEEFIMWSSFEFATLTLDDGFAMGSSMMPQKKNPGSVELLRGRTGRIDGLMVAGFVLMKSLPSGYNRDLHEEKEILEQSLTLINRASEIVPALVQSTTINKERMAELTWGNFSTATELANYLVKSHNVPFRETHHIVGSLVGDLTRAKDNFKNYPAVKAHLKHHNIDITDADLDAVLNGANVFRTYNCLGGTGPEAQRHMLKVFGEQLEQHRKTFEADKARLEAAYNTCIEVATTGNLQLAKQFVPK
jgi:argininosuccinate lyase